jgi:hypothetical protein
VSSVPTMKPFYDLSIRKMVLLEQAEPTLEVTPDRLRPQLGVRTGTRQLELLDDLPAGHRRPVQESRRLMALTASLRALRDLSLGTCSNRLNSRVGARPALRPSAMHLIH